MKIGHKSVYFQDEAHLATRLKIRLSGKRETVGEKGR